MTRGHAEALFPMIEEVLREAGADHAALTRIAVCTGPGSFTGIRAGVAAVRGLALGLGIPAVGISRLQAFASEDACTVAVPLRGASVALQSFAAGQVPANDACIVEKVPDDPDVIAPPEPALADPVRLARIAADVSDPPRPAPLYIRPADAMPPVVEPIRMLDQ